MANTNKISLELTESQLENLRQAFNTIESTIPALVGLTAKDRMGLPKMNDGNKPFAEDALNGLGIYPEVVPSYISKEEFRKDFSLYNQVDEFVQRSAKISQQFADLQLVAGSEAYTTALVIYRLAEAAAQAGVPGAKTYYEQLRKRFQAQGTANVPQQKADDGELKAASA